MQRISGKIWVFTNLIEFEIINKNNLNKIIICLVIFLVNFLIKFLIHLFLYCDTSHIYITLNFLNLNNQIKTIIWQMTWKHKYHNNFSFPIFTTMGLWFAPKSLKKFPYSAASSRSVPFRTPAYRSRFSK